MEKPKPSDPLAESRKRPPIQTDKCPPNYSAGPPAGWRLEEVTLRYVSTRGGTPEEKTVVIDPHTTCGGVFWNEAAVADIVKPPHGRKRTCHPTGAPRPQWLKRSSAPGLPPGDNDFAFGNCYYVDGRIICC